MEKCTYCETIVDEKQEVCTECQYDLRPVHLMHKLDQMDELIKSIKELTKTINKLNNN